MPKRSRATLEASDSPANTKRAKLMLNDEDCENDDEPCGDCNKMKSTHENPKFTCRHCKETLHKDCNSCGMRCSCGIVVCSRNETTRCHTCESKVCYNCVSKKGTKIQFGQTICTECVMFADTWGSATESEDEQSDQTSSDSEDDNE